MEAWVVITVFAAWLVHCDTFAPETTTPASAFVHNCIFSAIPPGVATIALVIYLVAPDVIIELLIPDSTILPLETVMVVLITVALLKSPSSSTNTVNFPFVYLPDDATMLNENVPVNPVLVIF